MNTNSMSIFEMDYYKETGLVFRMKKSSLHMKTVLKAKNPEIFSASPRPGGYIKSKSDKIFSDVNRISPQHYLNLNECLSSNKVRTELLYKSPTCKWNRRKFKTEIIKSKQSEAESFRTSDILAVTISCVMLMASEVPNIPEEYLKWAESYLECIKDLRGNYPPNVQGILNYIRYLLYGKASKNNSISPKSSYSDLFNDGIDILY